MENVQNEVMKTILHRRAIRRFEKKQIEEAQLQQILQAGLYAPSAGGRQGVLFVVCQDQEVNERLGKIKRANSKPKMATAASYVSKEQPSIADDPTLTNAFYDAPTVITMFAPKDFLFAVEDCAVAAENMMLAADSLGIGSCYIGAGWTAFADPYGQEILKEWGIRSDYYGVMQLLLGYPRKGDEHPTPKPRKADRIIRVCQKHMGTFGERDSCSDSAPTAVNAQPKAMDAKTCLQKLQYVGVLAFATVDGEGNPQVRNISAIHYESDGIYFFTARGKDFCRELLADGRVQILGYTRYKEMIRLSARAVPAADGEQKRWIDTIFAEQPYLSNVYPGDTRDIGIVFQIKDARIEYFHLGVNPIFRETYTIGKGKTPEKGYRITQDCIGCGTCARNCPQRCIESGKPYKIIQEHCLHCGNCYERCPVRAVKRRDCI